MEFQQIDRIDEWEPGKFIRAHRLLRAEETILKDHFPLFPVMPGVLMLEACFQAGMWLVLATDAFEHPLVTLQAARNVKYSDFVTPGQTLTVTMDVLKHEEQTTSFKAKGTVAGPDKESTVAFTARMVLERRHVADHYPLRAASEGAMRRGLRDLFEELTRSETN